MKPEVPEVVVPQTELPEIKTLTSELETMKLYIRVLGMAIAALVFL